MTIPDWEDDDWIKAVSQFVDPEDRTPSFEETHPEFLNRLRRSKRSVRLIAKWAKEEQKADSVNMLKNSEAPTRDVAHLYSDSGDIEINGKLCEVKGLTRNFSGASDWPFGKHYIVDGKGTYDKKARKPWAYYTVSACGKHAGYVHVDSTRDIWYVEKRFDRNTKRDAEFYFIPSNKVIYFDIHVEVEDET